MLDAILDFAFSSRQIRGDFYITLETFKDL